jgi:tetratricopeptide (TPR) repeat protein
MEARAWASDRSGALKAFARYEARLLEELDAKPGPDLVRMADLLRDGRRSPSRPAIPGYPPERADRRFEPETLIGREREFSVLFDAWSEARRKYPRIVVVTSDPGVGKTTLVNAFASTCQMDGAVVARAQAYDAERELPFAVLGELVKQLAMQRAIGGADPEALSELTRISSEVTRAYPGVPKPVEWAPELMPLRIADAFLKAVTAAAIDAPVMLVIDDIHAGDNASIAILHSVGRKLTDARVLLVLTGRSSELRWSVASWSFTTDMAIEGMRSLDLEVLPPEDARELIERRLRRDAKTKAPVERVLRASGCNPLAIELLAREWSEHGAESLLRDLEALDTQPVPSIGIPRAIGAVFDRQCERLQARARATLGLAAILGRRLTDLSLYAALDISPAIAMEALAELQREGFLRAVRGDLEFRNELIRAQAYYGVAGNARLQLHRRIGELLSSKHYGDDPTLALEISWHFLRGTDGERAIPFAHRGAEAFLTIGAPHEAERVLTACLDQCRGAKIVRRTRLLLAKSLLDQSKAEAALPHINDLSSEDSDSVNEQAEVALLRSTAEFMLNRESGDKYCEVATAALDYANRAGEANLIARALFECARAGNEQGVRKLIDVAEAGINELARKVDITTMPTAFVTRAFCKMYRMDPVEFLKDVAETMRQNSVKANAAQMAIVYSAKGFACLNLCRFQEAAEAYACAFDLSRRVGDDARMSLLSSNLCVTETARGRYDDAIRWGEMSIPLGESSNSSALQMTYTNLVDAYALTGKNSAAMELIERARAWLSPRRRWKFQCGFLVANAAFELVRGNTALAIEIIGDMERVARGREDANPIPGPYWKLRIFRAANLGRIDDARAMAQMATSMFRVNCPLHYLDVLAAKAWLESRLDGRISPETGADLRTFDDVGAHGLKALFIAQGFLSPSAASDSSDQKASLSALASGAGRRVPEHRPDDESRVTE